MYLSRIASVALAAALQVAPLCRVALSNQILAPSSFAVIFRLLAGTTLALGGYHTVSGASTIINSPKTAKGTNGVAFSYRITTGPDVANQWNATPLPTGLTVNRTSGKITGIPTQPGVFTVLLWASDNGRANRTVTANLALTIVDGTLVTPPSITSQPQGVRVNGGQNASFSVVAAGSTPLIYKWQQNGVNVAGGTAATLNLATVTAANAGDYRAIVSNSSGSVTSLVARLTVIVPPSLTAEPVSVTVGEGQPANFVVQADGTAPFSYAWAFNGTVIPDATNATLTLPAVSVADQGSYTASVINEAGSVISAAATLTVLPLPPRITLQPLAQTITAGSTLALTVAATGPPSLTYAWFFGNAPIPGAVTETFTLPNITTANSGDYHAEVSNAGGITVSDTVRITVQELINNELLLSPGAVGSDGLFSLQVTGPIHSLYVIWSSLDLAAWTAISTNEVADGVLSFKDPVIASGTGRFYRATLNP